MPSAWLGPQTNQCRQTRPFTGPWESCDSIRQEHALALAILLAGTSDKKAWFFRKAGSAAVLKIDGKQVTKVGEIELGGLPEGVAFSPDGAYAYVGNFLDRRHIHLEGKRNS